MTIPKNKRHLIVNKEYSRLPYWTDEGFEDVQRQTSQKYVQDSFGAFAESENQPPYLNDSEYDDGYQGLEYKYQDPQFPDIPDLNKDTAPKGTCYELWVSMFGSSPYGFFPTANEYAQLMEYAKKCPLIYMPHWCCSPSMMKISGPDKVAPGEKVEYTASGGLKGCYYSWDADRGWMVSGTYEAPMTPGSDTITVHPFLGDDRGKICAKKIITIEGGCHGVIGYTTLQMETGASQTLTVTGGVIGDTYTWATTAGTFDTDTGTSVVFTAPATNANCANNPTITLSCGGSVVQTIQIAVNGSGDTTNPAYRQAVGFSEFRCYYESSTCKWMCAFAASFYYNCAGTFLSVYSSGVGYSPSYNCGAGGGMGVGGACDAYPGVDCCSSTSTWCKARKAQYCTTCSTAAEAAALLGGADLRTAAMKTAGCCPAALL